MQITETIVSLDLEETIIESWYDQRIVNLRKVTSLLEQFQAKEIQIFSFAIRNDAEKAEFDGFLKPKLEDLLQVKITKVYTVDEVCLIIRKNFGAYWEPHEIPMVWGKSRSFVDVANAQAKRGTKWVLIDDMVEDVLIENSTRGIIVQTINI